MEQKISGKQVVKGIMILTVANILSKFIGVLYRIPVGNILGDTGNSIYGLAYQVYVLIITVSCLAIPNAVAKLVAECISLKAYKDAKRIFRITFIYIGGLSVVLALLLWFGAEEIALILKRGDNIILPLKALAPTVIVVSLMAVIRGYFQGLNDMIPTAVSQTVEQLFNGIFSIILASLFIPYGIKVAAMGSTLGTGIGAVAGMIAILVVYKHTYQKYEFMDQKSTHSIYPTTGHIIKQLIRTILPVVVTASLFALMPLIDNTMLYYYLPDVIETLRVMGKIDYIPVTNGALMSIDTIISSLSGQFLSKYTQFINIPVGIILVIITSSIPVIASEFVKEENKSLENKINRLLKIGMIIAMPSTVGLTLFGEPIMKFIYAFAPDGGSLFRVGSMAIIFITLAQLTTGMLQAMSKQYLVTLYVAGSLIIKVILNKILLPNYLIHVYAIPISTIVCYMIYALCNIYTLKKTITMNFNWKEVILKPLVCSVLMGGMSFSFYKGILSITHNITIAIIPTILFAILIYSILSFIGKVITIDDVKYMPIINKWIK